MSKPGKFLEKEGWEIRSEKGSITSEEESAALMAALSIPALPEMVFPRNQVVFHHIPTGNRLTFRVKGCLALWDHTRPAIQVSIAEKWKEGRQNVPAPVSYEYTFRSGYEGEVEGMERVPTSAGIDYERLKQRDDILLFDDCILFEDELCDAGVSIVNVKYRVMHYGFFILYRQFIRIDDTHYYIADVRYYATFDMPTRLMQEKSVRSCDHQYLKDNRLIPKDLSFLNDSNYMATILPLTHQSTCEFTTIK